MPPEISVGLITDEYFDFISLIGLTGRYYINTIDASLGPEIVAPHIQAATTVNSNFEEMDLLTAEPAEVAVVYFEIVIPLPNPLPGCVTIKKLSKPVRHE